MHSSASARPAAKPPGTSAPASTMREPLASVWTAMRSSAVLATRRSASVHARSFIPRSVTVILQPNQDLYFARSSSRMGPASPPMGSPPIHGE